MSHTANKKRIKQQAQDDLLFSAAVQFTRYVQDYLDEHDFDDEYTAVQAAYESEGYKALCQQFERIEKLFGYQPGSFHKGT